MFENIGQRLFGDQENRAVSPVIGVILMVAVTVILAATVAALVMGIGDDLGGTGPTLNADASANSDFEPDEGNDELFYISHTTGDSMESENIQVVLRDEDGAQLASLGPDDDSGTDFDGGSSYDVETSLDSDFDAGSTITVDITEDSPGSGDEFISDGYGDGDMTVQLIHTPSDTTVVDSTLTVPDN